MTDLLLRRVSKSRAGADGPDDYDVAGPDGLVVGRIFKANTSPVGTPWMWTLHHRSRINIEECGGMPAWPRQFGAI
jgi:hypothetical protein